MTAPSSCSADPGRDRIELSETTVHLWHTESPSPPESERSEVLRAVLSSEERARNEGMKSASAQGQNLIGAALARDVLGRHAQIDPAAWRFRRTERGRPEIVAPPEQQSLRFNLAHTEGLVACAVTCGSEIGLDVESTDRKLELLPFARRWFAPDEATALEQLDGKPLRDRFFSLWTLKEAYLKARGVGMARSPRSLSFSFPRPGIIAARFHSDLDDEPDSWRFALFHLSPRFYVATALRSRRSGSPRYITHQIDPLSPGEGDSELTLLAESQT